MAAFDLWLSAERSRYFLVPEACDMPSGDFEIRTIPGRRRQVAFDAIKPFELTENQALRVAKDQLGQTLDELRHGIDQKLDDLRERLDERKKAPVNDNTTLTPDAAPVLLDLLKKLPGVIANSLAPDAQRVASATSTMADLQRRLQEAGIDLDERFTSFPERLAELREDARKQQP
ncbi:hypothetical protein [Massilia antarctica]|uniref:hypothetical protein n=1 Tax=Massilia antarctica TaxID=2765360 RepID=UPI0006BB8533|nr:hypothetical protein [Massilia sp. H27-R4]MCY0916368.1 hypothetical protein [Massilia sp. H27-R4]CUI07380.1 hypothetical protein BN2497_9537 [Janthinobacterium sp. CG23_2]CUU31166.1 hypothetical protein BN3177_9537 [Janthinobacterium sp. CG23_2]